LAAELALGLAAELATGLAAGLEQPGWLAGQALVWLAPGQEQRSEPLALRKYLLWAVRLAQAVLAQAGAYRAELGSAALPEFQASAAWTVRRASPSVGEWASAAARSRPPVPRRRSDWISGEFPDGLDHGLEWCAFHRPVARE
jgi:hypothetical protein